MTDLKYPRLSVNVAYDAMAVFQTLCRRYAVSATEGVRRMIAIWQFITNELDAGHQLAGIKIEDGKVTHFREIVMLDPPDDGADGTSHVDRLPAWVRRSSLVLWFLGSVGFVLMTAVLLLDHGFWQGLVLTALILTTLLFAFVGTTSLFLNARSGGIVAVLDPDGDQEKA